MLTYGVSCEHFNGDWPQKMIALVELIFFSHYLGNINVVFFLSFGTKPFYYYWCFLHDQCIILTLLKF